MYMRWPQSFSPWWTLARNPQCATRPGILPQFVCDFQAWLISYIGQQYFIARPMYSVSQGFSKCSINILQLYNHAGMLQTIEPLSANHGPHCFLQTYCSILVIPDGNWGHIFQNQTGGSFILISPCISRLGSDPKYPKWAFYCQYHTCTCPNYATKFVFARGLTSSSTTATAPSLLCNIFLHHVNDLNRQGNHSQWQ